MLLGRAKPKIDLTKGEKRGYLTEVVCFGMSDPPGGKESVCHWKGGAGRGEGKGGLDGGHPQGEEES